MSTQWETVIGLEVHVQLATSAKIFSGASTAFGAEPNSQACAIDLGLPGILPVVNEQAVHKAIAFGLGIQAKINQTNVFERKHYFYPDLPKGYQTTQLQQPIVDAGYLNIQADDGSTKAVRIHHAHLEEDAGKSLHDAVPNRTSIDLNRAGVPLLEVVSEPDMSSAKEAVAYVKALHNLVRYLGICDGNMAEGSLRCDANVSVREKGQQKLGTRCEIKNINSFKFIEKAIDYEVQRQIDLIESGGQVIQQTRLYNANSNETRAMRSKEEANDYRYFPCPDLLPVKVDDKTLEQIRSQLPELPEAKKQRFIEQLQLSAYDAELLTADLAVANYFEALAKQTEAKLAANWVMGEIASYLNAEQLGIQEFPLSVEQMAGLLQRVMDNSINSKTAKQVFVLQLKTGQDADRIIEDQGLKQVTDTGAIDALVEQVMEQNPKQVANYQAAEPAKRGKMIGFFVGKIMQASKGKANPAMVNQVLAEKLKG